VVHGVLRDMHMDIWTNLGGGGAVVFAAALCGAGYSLGRSAGAGVTSFFLLDSNIARTLVHTLDCGRNCDGDGAHPVAHPTRGRIALNDER
jgi:hypothetical protein